MSIRQQFHLDEQTYTLLRRYCKANGKSLSSVGDAAIRAYLDDTTDSKLLFRRLDRHTRLLDKANRDVQLLSEAFAVCVKLWFAHTPRIGASEQDAAQTSAAQRYEQYCDYVAQQIAGGHAFVDDLAEDAPVSLDDLKAVLAQDHE